MDDHHPGSAPPSCDSRERAEPETRIAEADLLQDDDLSPDVDALVVGLVASADEHELAAARRRRRR